MLWLFLYSGRSTFRKLLSVCMLVAMALVGEYFLHRLFGYLLFLL